MCLASPSPCDTASLPMSVLDTHWWAGGLALHERVAGCPDPPATIDEAVHARLACWRDRYAGHAPGLFARRLAAIGLDETRALALLAEHPAALAARVRRPDWVSVAEDVLATARPRRPGADLPRHWRVALAEPLRPLISYACRKVLAHLAPLADTAHVDATAILATFARQLRDTLTRLAFGPMVAELHRRRDAGQLRGNDARQRFDDFVRQLCDPVGLATLFGTYPVLARLLTQTCQYEIEAYRETVDRFARDRPEIVQRLLGGVDPGPLRGIQAARCDSHQHRRQVRLLTFAGEATVVYKPRSLAAQVALAGMVAWLNATSLGLDIRTPATVARPGYGWMEFVDNAPAADRGAVGRFYIRLGALLALLHAVHATDMHCENLIACGDQPVIVDAETLFHPTLPDPRRQGDPAWQALAGSVARVGLLPSLDIGPGGGADISGFGGDAGADSAHQVVDWAEPGTDQMRQIWRAGRYHGVGNRPRVAGAAVVPDDFQAEFMRGFVAGADVVTRNQAELARIIGRCGEIEVRVVVRPTQSYLTLLRDSYHPDLLRDALDRDQHVDALWLDADGDDLRWLTSAYEAMDLWDNDIPLFRTRPASVDIWTSTDHRLPHALVHPELDRVLRLLSTVDSMARQDQEWIIAATMATRRPYPLRRGGRAARSRPAAAAPAQPDRLLAASCSIADRLVATVSTPIQTVSTELAERGRVNWIGLEYVDERHWLVLPMGAGLANGYLGVALFLAQLSSITGIRRYAAVAADAVVGYRQIHELMTAQPALASLIGCGGVHGLGAITYGLARLVALGTIDGSDGLIEQSVDLARAAAHDTGVVDYANGLSGCAVAMSGVSELTGLESAHRLALDCAQRTLDLVTATEGVTDSEGATAAVGLPDGFAEGIGGVAFALARLAYGRGAYRDAARRLLAAGSPAGGDVDSPHVADRSTKGGWCRGLAGRLIAEHQARLDGPVPEDTRRLVEALAKRPVARDLSLCHGELGVIDALSSLDELYGGEWAPAWRRRAGLVLEAIERSGPICGTPDGVPTPGLLNGLAGIGYQLLRLRFPADVSSVLLLGSRLT